MGFRKISKSAVCAFMNGYNFSKNNTVVKHTDNSTVMYLHGHPIATVDKRNPQVLKVNDCGYNTMVTHERISTIVREWTGGLFSTSKRKGGVVYCHALQTETPMINGKAEFARA